MDFAQRPAIYKIGLTGGIGTGKSEIAKAFAKRSILVIDLDFLAKELVEMNPTIQQEYLRIIGPQAITDGLFDRKKAREVVFSDEKIRLQLEELVHPVVRNEFEKRAQLAAEGGHKIVICEAALLFEAGYQDVLDEMILVSAEEPVRIRRITQRDGIPAELAKKIIKAQRRKYPPADLNFANNGNLEEIEVFVDQCLKRWKEFGWL